MTVNKLASHTTLLLVVDIQEAFVPHIHEMERVIERSRVMIRAARLLDVPIIASEQYPKGLGRTVEPIRQALGECRYFEKTAFSVWGDEALREAILQTGRPQVLLVGIETHVCIAQTALDLLAAGITPYLALDAISSRTARDADVARERLSRAGAIPMTVEAAILEMTVTARHPKFKEISRLIK